MLSTSPLSGASEYGFNMTLTPELIDSLKATFGERFSTSLAILEHHGRDESPYPLVMPDGVVFALCNEEVATVLRLCNQYGVPVSLMVPALH